MNDLDGKTNAPAIRFKVFTEDWEQCKLRDEATELVAGGDVNKELISENGKFPVIANALTNEGIVGYYDKEFRIKAPAVTITGRGDVGHAKARKVDFTPVVRLLTFKSKHDVDFIENAINRLSIIIESTGVPQLTVPQIGNYEINFPKSREEEKTIGKFFLEVDNLIILHQRKFEKLQNVKKAMLEKMFPKNGNSVPEIRFAGFTDAWEQRKLSDIASMKARIGWQGLKKEEFLDEGDYYLITGTDFSDGRVDLKNCHFIDQERYNQDPNIQIKNGDVLITKDGTIGKVAYVSDLNKPATLNAGVFVVKGKHKSISNLYLYHYLAAPYLLQFADQQATGGTIKHLNQNVLVNFPVPLPKVEEQEQIGQLLLYIDNLIILHQRKLEKLKNLKKACLEKMFV